MFLLQRSHKYFPIIFSIYYKTTVIIIISSVQFSSVAESCPTLCNPMNHSMPGLPVHHQLPESTSTHVHCVRDAIQPSLLLLPSIFPSIRVLSNKSAFRIRWTKYWSFSFNIPATGTRYHRKTRSDQHYQRWKAFLASSLQWLQRWQYNHYRFHLEWLISSYHCSSNTQ